MNIAVLGTGYVGLVTAAGLAEFGHTVVGADKVAAKIDAIRAGRIPIYEPGLDALLAANLHDRPGRRGPRGRCRLRLRRHSAGRRRQRRHVPDRGGLAPHR
jgi:nucleoside-diphosphate-sugar epimerase